MVKTVLILGGSYAGLAVAHTVLKKSAGAAKVVLVNPSDHFYYNMATVRAVIPGQFTEDQIFYSIPNQFKAYPAASFEFVQGTAESVDDAKKTVSVSTAAGTKALAYNELVIATGSNTIGKAPWKANGLSDAAMRKELKASQELVAKAKSIVVGGAGATGVELSAELGFAYGSTKEITLISAGSTILEGTPLTAAQLKSGQAELEKLKVKIVNNTKVTSHQTLPSGQTEITLSTGSTLLADLYLPTVGIAANTSFLPKNFTNAKGEVTVDKFLHVKSTTDIWAVGDVSDLERSGIMIAKAQAQHLGKNLVLALNGKAPLPYAVPEKDAMVVTLGKSKGVGIMKGFKLPSFMVSMAKGKNFMIGSAKSWADGSSV